ncbi:hypothetical protein NN561_015368 [Cricetulus griseus]
MARDGSGRFGRRLGGVREGSGEARAAAGPLGLRRPAGLVRGAPAFPTPLEQLGSASATADAHWMRLVLTWDRTRSVPTGPGARRRGNPSAASEARSWASGQRETECVC